MLGAGESLDAAEARLWEGRGLRASVRLDEAVACLTKAADDLQGEPGAKERDLLGEVLLTLGDCLVDNNQAAAAVLIADKMRTLALPVPADPVAADRLAFHAARSGYVRGRALFLLDEDERAREALDTYQNGVEAISRRHPENVIWTAALAESWNHAAYAAAGREDYKTELEAYRKAHELSRQLCSRDPSNVSWFRELSLSYRCLAGSLARLGRTQESLAEVQNYLTTCRPILSRAGASPVENRELAEGLREIAVLMQGFEDPVQAIALHQQAIELCLALIRSEPWNDRNFWGFCESVEACAGLATHANPPTNAKAVFQKWIDFAHNEASARTESGAAWRDAEASLYARCCGQLQSEHDMLGAADQMSQAVKLREVNLSVNSKSAKALSSSFMWLTDAQIRAHRTEAAIATVDRHVSLWEQRFGAAGPHLPGAYDLVKAGSLLKRVLDNGEHGIEVQALASRILALIDLPDASESDLNRLKHLSELRLLAPPPTQAAPPL